MEQSKRESLRRAVRHFYDLQKMRISTRNRDHRKTDDSAPAAPPIILDEHDQAFMASQAEGLLALEKQTLKEVRHHLKGIPIASWLNDQKGVGPTMAGVLVAEIDITRCNTPSALWAYCGLACDTTTGKAVRRQKGVKSNWNPFLKTKVIHVLGGSFLKCNSPWRKFYDDYKHRKTEAGWGASDGHRHNAAMRYMVKMFLLELWTTWRQLEGLPVTEPYSEAVLGRVHGDHGGMGAEATA